MNNKRDLYLKQLQCITYFHLYLSSNLFRSMFMKISIMYFEIDENGYKIRKTFHYLRSNKSAKYKIYSNEYEAFKSHYSFLNEEYRK